MARTKKSDVQAVLGKIPVKELRAFVSEQLANQEVNAAFLKCFSKYFVGKQKSPEAYISQIQEVYQECTLEHNYVSFRDQSKLSSKMYDTIDVAKQFVKEGNVEAAIDIAFTILEENVAVISNTDDSYGYLGTIMTSALLLLEDISGMPLDDECRESFKDWCRAFIEDGDFEGWHWYTEPYKLWANVAKTPEECQEVLDAMHDDEELQKDSSMTENECLSIQRTLIEKTNDEEGVRSFMLQHIDNPGFREQFIKDAIEKRDFLHAYQLCEEGLKVNEGYRYYEQTWNEYLLQTAQAEGNAGKIVEYARRLYLDDCGDSDKLFGLIKENVEPEVWPDYVEQLAKDVRKSRKPECYAAICASEGWNDRLLEYLSSCHRLSLLKKYEYRLSLSDKQGMVDCYVAYIDSIMEYGRGRDVYDEVIECLNRIIHLGDTERAVEVAGHLRNKYARCRLLIDKLRNR